MNIRARLIVLFVSIVALIMLSSSVAIYFFSADHREDDFYRRLESKGRITARLLIEVDEVDEILLKRIEKDNPISLSNEKITIYDYKNQILYTSDDEREIRISDELLDQVRLDEQVKFTQKGYEALGFLYADKFDRFVVIVAATDIYGLIKLRNLGTILIVVFASSILIILLSAAFYVGRVLKPIASVIQEVDEISATSMHRRLAEGDGKDEISRLAQTFNGMLGRLETAFNSQKQFIANASHELRNPLAGLLVEIDVCLISRRTGDEYEGVLRSLRDDITSLKTVSNRMLMLVQASMENVESRFSLVRVDELLWEAKTEVTKIDRSYTVSIEMDRSIDDDASLNVMGDEQLLKGAFVNVMENGCKYARDNSVSVRLTTHPGQLILDFIDRGVGIPGAELANVFEPFFRGSNVSKIKGNGIGLSLVWRIIKNHAGSISIDSSLTSGTTVNISLPLANHTL
jgi:signal transduction histidine kinase